MNMKTRLAVHFLTNFKRMIPFSFIPACARAIRNMERDRAIEEITLPNGLRRTSGDIIGMFELGSFVNWYKASMVGVADHAQHKAVHRLV